jgi:hypothetical protein
MSGYAFSSEQVALFLRDYAHSRGAGLGVEVSALGREVITVKAPSSSIPAIDGTTISSGLCTRAYIDGDELGEVESIELPVLNMSGGDIEADSFFQAAKIGIDWVAISGGGGSSVCQVLANSEITAASGTTLGQGLGNKLKLSNDASQLISDGTELNIRNPWEEAIASGSMMTCYSSNAYYIVIQVSCPEEDDTETPETP